MKQYLPPMHATVVLFCLLLVSGIVVPSLAHAEPTPLTFGGFLDTYYAYDFNDLQGRKRPYTTQAYVNDEPRVNLAMIDGKYEDDAFRSHLAVQAGDSVWANYSGEPHRFFRYIQEGTVGFKLSDDLWFDAGIYLAHIGLEGFNSRDNWTLTRSLIADYSPYYEEGAKLTYQFNPNLSGQLHILNGWQNISSAKHPALGAQLAYAVDKDTSLVYNNFIGDEGDTRILNDFIVKTALSKETQVGAELQVGYQDVAGPASAGWWHGWGLFAQQKICSDTAIGLRVERFVDAHKIDLVSLSDESFKAWGASINLDYEILPKLLWRTEYRAFFGGNEVFPEKDNKFSATDSLITTSLQYSFSS